MVHLGNVYLETSMLKLLAYINASITLKTTTVIGR